MSNLQRTIVNIIKLLLPLLLIILFLVAGFMKAEASETGAYEFEPTVVEHYINKPLELEPIYLYSGAWSMHSTAKGQNETHDLIGFEYVGVTVMGFKNSFYDDSIYIGYTFDWEVLPDVVMGVSVGGVSGYHDKEDYKLQDLCTGSVCWIAYPQITYTGLFIQPSIMLLGDAVAFAIRWEI